MDSSKKQQPHLRAAGEENMNIISMLAGEFKLSENRVETVVQMLDEGKTVPFIARYRKEATGGMDDQLLRELSERLGALRNVEKRAGEIRAALENMGVLTNDISAQIERAKTLAELEDIYRPYRPKRRTRATIAREKGLEPLAGFIMLQKGNEQQLLAEAARFIDAEKEIEDCEAALAGARDILAETFSNDADLRRLLRTQIQRSAVL